MLDTRSLTTAFTHHLLQTPTKLLCVPIKSHSSVLFVFRVVADLVPSQGALLLFLMTDSEASTSLLVTNQVSTRRFLSICRAAAWGRLKWSYCICFSTSSLPGSMNGRNEMFLFLLFSWYTAVQRKWVHFFHLAPTYYSWFLISENKVSFCFSLRSLENVPS